MADQFGPNTQQALNSIAAAFNGKKAKPTLPPIQELIPEQPVNSPWPSVVSGAQPPTQAEAPTPPAAPPAMSPEQMQVKAQELVASGQAKSMVEALASLGSKWAQGQLTGAQ